MALNNHVENFTLDMAPGGIAPVLNVSQGDTGRAYTADMYWGGASYDVSGLTVRLRGRKRDNTVFDYALPAPSGTKVSFDLQDKEQVTIIPGNVECELVFTDSDSRVVGTGNFVFIVEEAPYDPDAPSTSDISGIGTNSIEDGAITTAKLADNSVTPAKLANGSVTNEKINGGAVSEDKLSSALLSNIKKWAWTMADVLPSPYGYVEYDTTEQTLTIPRDFTFYANGIRYTIASETVIDVSYTTHSSSTHIVQYVVSTGQFEVKSYNTFTADENHILICIIRGLGAGQNIGKLSINGPYKQDGYLYNINLEPYLNIDTYPYTYGYSEFYGKMQFNPLNFISANLNQGNVNPNSPSAATSYNIFQFPTPCTIQAEDGYRFGVHLLNNDDTFATDPGWQQVYNMPAGQKFKLIITNWPRSASAISLETAREWVKHVSFITEAQQISNPTSGLYHYYGERVSLKRHTYNCGVLFNTAKPTEITTDWQGSTVYDGKLFRLANTGDVAVYEMGHSTAIATFSLGSKADDNHANSCSFGAEKYSDSSAFPMLYVTAGSGTDIKLVVEDIHENNGAYTSTKVQEITYDKSSLAAAGFIDGWGWPCWVVDSEKGYLYTIGTIRQSSSSPDPSSDNTNKMVFNKFKIPDKSLASVTLTAADLLEQWTTPFEPMLTQGACYYNGYIFAVYGLGSNYQNAVCVYDTVQRAMVARLDCTLNQDPLYNKEPEDCSVYNNKLIVTTAGNDVYNIEFM